MHTRDIFGEWITQKVNKMWCVDSTYTPDDIIINDEDVEEYPTIEAELGIEGLADKLVMFTSEGKYTHYYNLIVTMKHFMRSMFYNLKKYYGDDIVYFRRSMFDSYHKQALKFYQEYFLSELGMANKYDFLDNKKNVYFCNISSKIRRMAIMGIFAKNVYEKEKSDPIFSEFLEMVNDSILIIKDPLEEIGLRLTNGREPDLVKILTSTTLDNRDLELAVPSYLTDFKSSDDIESLIRIVLEKIPREGIDVLNNAIRNNFKNIIVILMECIYSKVRKVSVSDVIQADALFGYLVTFDEE